MIKLFGQYDVCVVGSGVTGIIAAISAARAGAKVLMIEAGAALGGMLTLGRLTTAAGHVQGGIFLELLKRVEAAGGGDTRTRIFHESRQTGMWDPAAMRRMILEMIVEAGVEVLLHAQVTDVLMSGVALKGIYVQVKSGLRLVLTLTVIDATGDADVAFLAGSQIQSGRESDGLHQPMSSYVRMLGVDLPTMARYVRNNPDDFMNADIPEPLPESNLGYLLNVKVAGFGALIRRARVEGFNWTLPRDRILIKTGLIPGEVNLNVTRFNGDPMDERDRSNAELEIERQAYVVADFMRRYVPGFNEALLLEVAPRIGVRESRRIVGEHVVTAQEVRSEARFDDAIGLSECFIDVHDPESPAILLETVGTGHGLPYRCLLPKGTDGLLVAGRCASADHIAMGSMRNTPACALMGEAAGVAAAMAAEQGTSVRNVDIAGLQQLLLARGIVLGTPDGH